MKQIIRVAMGVGEHFLGWRMVEAETLNYLAVHKDQYILMGINLEGRERYSITHIATGRIVASGIKSLDAALECAKALEESIDFSSENPDHYGGEAMTKLRDYYVQICAEGGDVKIN